MTSARSEEFASYGGSCSFANLTSSRSLLIRQALTITLVLSIYLHFIFLKLPTHKGVYKYTFHVNQQLIYNMNNGGFKNNLAFCLL